MKTKNAIIIRWMMYLVTVHTFIHADTSEMAGNFHPKDFIFTEKIASE